MGAMVSVKDMVEKPAVDEAPSNLAVIGRYILAPEIMDQLGNVGKGAGGEIQLTDAIAAEIASPRPVTGFCFEGTRFDCGSKAGFLQATVSFASRSGSVHQSAHQEPTGQQPTEGHQRSPGA